ncbi:MAG: plastocyanin/azurin family copper-binding protein [Chloroflexota bacterium]
MRLRHRGLFAGLALLVASASGGAYVAHAQHHSSTAHKTKIVHVKMVHGAFAFSPKSITITVGTKVMWKDSTGVAHTVTATKGAHFNKQLAASGKTSITFKKAGTISYICSIHPFMKGKITVKK